MKHLEINSTSFKTLFFKEYESLLKIALYIVKDYSIAEDIVQEVFAKLWEKKEELYSVKDVNAYLAQMTRNLAFDKYKASLKLKKTKLELSFISEDSPSENEPEIKKALEEAVSHLSPKCRLIFSLSRFEGLSNNEISEYLNISKRTVETQISNALKAFRTDLRPIFEAHLSLIAGLSIASILQQL
ncbi:MAG: RNA polymerase sigma-70 factor [Balneolaceae bacterium]